MIIKEEQNNGSNTTSQHTPHKQCLGGNSGSNLFAGVCPERNRGGVNATRNPDNRGVAAKTAGGRVLNEFTLNHAVTNHEQVKQWLRNLYEDIDEQTLLDTVEGETDLVEILIAMERNRQEILDRCAAIDQRKKELDQRKMRFQDQADALKTMIISAMLATDRKSIQAPDFTITRRPGSASIEIIDEDSIPARFKQITQTVKTDKQAIKQAIKQGEDVQGARLREGQPTLMIKKD